MSDKMKNLGNKADEAFDAVEDRAEDVAETVEVESKKAAGRIKSIFSKVNVTHVVAVAASAAAVAGMVLLARQENEYVVVEVDDQRDPYQNTAGDLDVTPTPKA